MANKYNQGAVSVSSARFTKAPMGELEFSRMYAEPSHTTTFNAGDIVPVYCGEVLPHGTYSMDVDSVIRQATLLVPSMDRAIIDIFAYFVPNRVVNKSWKNVMGENSSGSWSAPAVSLAPLASLFNGNISNVQNQIPPHSVADYYGIPTQRPIPIEVLMSMHDLKFRGYLEIYNNYFRDQNYQPPIPYSKLNVYNGFLEKNPATTPVSYSPKKTNAGNMSRDTIVPADVSTSGEVGEQALAKALLESDSSNFSSTLIVPARFTNWRAYDAPLKANKLHDYFTSVLPSPQKGEQVIVGIGERAPVIASSDYLFTDDDSKLLQLINQGSLAPDSVSPSYVYSSIGNSGTVPANSVLKLRDGALYTDLSQATGISIADLRDSVAVQQVYEILGRGGSRYTEYINSFFELDIDNPFDDIPTCLGHIRRNLDLYQTAQTSASTDNSAQGNLSAFGYTSTGGKLFTRTFLEHGYIHIMAVVRHKNIYPAMISRDNFRLSMMDFYQYPLANISEQPVYTREINPYAGNNQVFGYQEAWAEYRTEPDRVSGLMRTGEHGEQGVEEYPYIDQWTYADPFDPNLLFADGQFMESNSKEVIDRGTAFLPTDDINNTPQFKAKFTFKIIKELPMPTYSMAGLDIL